MEVKVRVLLLDRTNLQVMAILHMLKRDHIRVLLLLLLVEVMVVLTAQLEVLEEQVQLLIRVLVVVMIFGMEGPVVLLDVLEAEAAEAALGVDLMVVMELVIVLVLAQVVLVERLGVQV
jgi:hypothetical protein